MHCHVQDTIVILEEGNLLNPRYLDCDMFIPWAVLNRRHPATSICAQGAEINRRNLLEEEAQAGTVTAFRDYYRPLETVLSFK